MAIKTATKKSSRKTVKPAPIKAPKKSPEATLASALAASPHVGGWNGEVAEALAVQVVALTRPDMSLRDALVIFNQYKNVAGWKNMVKTAAATYLTAPRPTNGKSKK